MSKKHRHSLNIFSKIHSKDKKFKGKPFWKRNPNNNKYIIVPALLREFISANGISLLDYYGNKLIVKNTVNIVNFKTYQGVYNFCLERVLKEEIEALTSEFIVTGARLLINTKALIGSLNELKLNKYRDTKYSSLYFFRNTVIEITKDEINEISYSILKKRNQYITISQIIDRDFNIKHKQNSQFKRLLKLTTNSKDHYLSVITIIGYLLHRYKNPSIAKAVIISDILSQATNEPHGRSGKGIIINALSQLTTVVEYNGKNLDLKRDKFAFQNTEPDTNLTVLQDVGRSFDFEDLFSTITDSINIERKHEKKIIVNYEDSPKIIITTNYNVPQNSDSYSDRKLMLLLNNFFNSQNKPEHIFKNILFSDWDNNEFMAFDSFMMNCLRKYLKHGLIAYNDPALRKLNLISNTSKDFIEIIEEQYSPNTGYHNLKDLAEQLGFDSTVQKNVKSKITKEWLTIYAKFKELKLDTRISGGITKFSLSKKS